MERFGIALEQMIPLGSTLASLLAAGILVAEISVGVMLLLGMQTGRAALCALALAGSFAGYQAGRLLRGVEAPCYCLGVLGNLPATADLGVDMVLVLLSLVVLRKANASDHLEKLEGPRWYAWLAVVIPASFLSIPLALRDAPMMTSHCETVLEKLKAGRVVDPTGETGLVLCLNLDEFHCALCFDDLVSLLDSLHAKRLLPHRDEVAAVFRSGETFSDSSGWELRRWARETGISGPIVVVDAGEFDSATGGKSALWLVEGTDRIVKRWDLPLGATRQTEVLATLEGK